YTFIPNESSDPGTHHYRGILSAELVPALRRWKPDAILVYGWKFQSHLAVLRAFHGKTPVLFRGDSTLLDEAPGIRKWLRRATLRRIYRNIDLALYVGRHNRDYYLRHGVEEQRLVWAPHSVENDRFSDPDGRLEQQAHSWRRTQDIDDDAKVIL